MLAKIGLAVVVLVCAALPLSQVNYGELYNEMYPVNGLKRDVLGLCTVAKSTFVRAIASDRINCYDSMPDKLDVAIGWVRTTDRLMAEKPPTEVQVAEKVLAAAVMRQQFGLAGQPLFTGYVTAPAAVRPCAVAALQPAANPLMETNEHLAQRIAKGDDPALTALGLAPRQQMQRGAREAALPVLPLTGARPRVASGNSAARDTASPADPMMRPGLGDSAGAAAATACGTRA